MECKKTEIKEKSCVLSKSIDVDIDYQENLMSYSDDMLKIIRCNINNFVVNSVYKNSSITVYGKSRIFLTYISESTGCLSTAEFEEDFEKIIPVDGDYEDLYAEIKLCNKYSNYRVINQRRIDIHNSFVLHANAFSDLSFQMICDNEEVLIDKQTVSHISRIGSAYVKSEFEEEASVADNASIKKIINIFSYAECDDVKIVSDKMLVKSMVHFSILYTTDTEHEEIKRCEKITEISTIVDINSILENDIPIINICVGNLFAKAKTDKNNELKLIEIIGDININCAVYRQSVCELSADSYSVNSDIENKYNTVELQTDFMLQKDSLTENMQFEFDNINITQVLDLSVSLADKNTVEFSAFVLDEKSEIHFITDSKKIVISESAEIQAFITSFDYVIKSENVIDVRFIVKYSALEFQRKKFKVVSDIELKSDGSFESPALVVYFADEKERLWDIAKTFRTSVELIKKENELTADVLDSKRILLIPGM
ncbi:MAG: DUF3794 domain-containing protein [Clostridiales bacterium]|nr:DUF3794 domain-containing protein [Clostridiales bacterium]